MPKCKHLDLDFTWEEQAKMHRKGMVQTQCPECRRWFWPREWDFKKRSPKTKTVKAWAAFNREGEIYSIRFTPLDYRVFKPCTVTAAAKWFKGRK